MSRCAALTLLLPLIVGCHRSDDAADGPGVVATDAPRAPSAIAPVAPAAGSPTEVDARPAGDAPGSDEDARAVDLLLAAKLAEEDAPLPSPDEIPSFLQPQATAGTVAERSSPPVGARDEHPPASPQPPRATSDRDASFAALMAKVVLGEEGEDDEGSFASVISGEEASRDDARGLYGTPVHGAASSNPSLPDRELDSGDGAAAVDATTRYEAPPGFGSPGGDEAWALAEGPTHEAEPNGSSPAEDDRCASIRASIAQRKAYLQRIGAERDSFSYVEDAGDASALRLLQGLRRCAEYPDDEDCQPRPIEVDVSALEPPRHQFEVRPSDLEAEFKAPDDVPQDPQIRELLHQLSRCELDQRPQPLLDRRSRPPR